MSAILDIRHPVPAMHSWRYIDRGSTRDLRIDFLRGLVFILLFTSHFRYFSWFSLVAWERIGVVSSAETFIILAGIVTGAVYGKRLETDGLGVCAIKLFRRAWTLYKIAVIVAASIALLRFVPGISTDVLTEFIDPVKGIEYSLYPSSDQWLLTFYHVIFLKAAPDQFQVIGLYVVLFLLTPLIFWAIARGHVAAMLLLSWLAYLYNLLTPEPQTGTAAIRLTEGQFEFAFPLIAWQLIFVHGVVLGYYKKQVLEFFPHTLGHWMIATAMVLSILFALFSLNHPLPQLPDWAVMSFIPPDSFNRLYEHFFLKYKLGPGRLLNNIVLLISLFALLTLAWKPINRICGWLFIPLGQESMYVFFLHVYLILLVANTPLSAMHNIWINTGIHAGSLLLCWLAIRTRFLFRWIPH